MKSKSVIVAFFVSIFVILVTLSTLAVKNTESSSFWEKLVDSMWRSKFGNLKRPENKEG